MFILACKPIYDNCLISLKEHRIQRLNAQNTCVVLDRSRVQNWAWIKTLLIGTYELLTADSCSASV
jgi:hypothetical protein